MSKYARKTNKKWGFIRTRGTRPRCPKCNSILRKRNTLSFKEYEQRKEKRLFCPKGCKL